MSALPAGERVRGHVYDKAGYCIGSHDGTIDKYSSVHGQYRINWDDGTKSWESPVYLYPVTT